MDIFESYQADNEVFESVKFDLVIASSGYEERCDWLMTSFNIQAEDKIALISSKKHRDIFKGKTNKTFREKGFSFLNLPLEKDDSLIEYLEQYVNDFKGDELNILIDYSCMTKVWYSGILNLFSKVDNATSSIHVYFSYTPVKYQKSKKIRPIKLAESFYNSSKTRNNGKPTVLIIGLGIEPGNADYIKELIKPDKTILLYPDPAPKGYVELLFENNKHIINEIDMRNMINLPLDDLNSTIETVTNLILNLRLKSNIIIAPLGPKTFSLVSMLINAHYPDVDIWRIRSNMLQPEIKKQALLSPIILKVSFTGADE